MFRIVLAACFALTAGRSLFLVADQDCRLTGWMSPAGLTVWGCTDAVCGNALPCRKTESVDGDRTTVVCDCVTYSPNNMCDAVGYYDAQPDGTFLAVYDCWRNGCPVVCTEQTPGPVPVVMCDC